MVESSDMLLLVRDHFADSKTPLSDFLLTLNALSLSRFGVLDFE